MTDESIAAWVGRQLTGPGAVRKSPALRRMRGALIGGTGNPENSSRLWEDTEVFISYRSADAAAARRLAAELSAGRHHGGRPMRTVLLEPGQLAHPEEVLSPLLRWNTLAVISPRLYPVPPASLEEHARDGGELHCPNGCGMLFTISPLPPRYLWYALPVGPHSSFLESLPAYKATSVQATR